MKISMKDYAQKMYDFYELPQSEQEEIRHDLQGVVKALFRNDEGQAGRIVGVLSAYEQTQKKNAPSNGMESELGTAELLDAMLQNAVDIFGVTGVKFNEETKRLILTLADLDEDDFNDEMEYTELLPEAWN